MDNFTWNQFIIAALQRSLCAVIILNIEQHFCFFYKIHVGLLEDKSPLWLIDFVYHSPAA